MKSRIWGGFLLATISAIMMPALAGAVTVDTQSTRIGDNENSPQIVIVNRQVTGVKNYVYARFGYTLTADESNPAPVNNLATAEMSLYVSEQPDANTNIASGAMSFQMSQVVFSELGDYKFILREVSSSDPENYPVDEEHEYYIYVSVRNQLLAGVPTGNLVATLVNQVRDHDTGAKTSALFTSEAVRTRIELSKNVTGNLANTEEYFKFLVTINGRTGDQYTISGQDNSVTYGGENVSTASTFVVGEDGVEVYLRHGQTITIGLGTDDLNEVPIGVEYTVEEIGADDYSTTVDGNDGKLSAEKITAVLALDNTVPSANQTSFVNHKESAVLTGITLAMIPAVILIVAMFVSAVIVRKVKKDSSNKR